MKSPVGNTAAATNRFFAIDAGIRPNSVVLDAGCGVCGPSIDIASAIDEVSIKAITISPAQALTGKELVQNAGLVDRVAVLVGDYHSLPFRSNAFDTAVFLESSGYSYDRRRLFNDVFRVLLPGGVLYIKDLFIKDEHLSEYEKNEIAHLNRIYSQLTSTLKETVTCVKNAGFKHIERRSLNGIVDNTRFERAMFSYQHGSPILNEFGRSHYYPFVYLPMRYFSIKARKPV